MEYVEGSVVKHVYENVKPEDLHPILEALAAIQSIELSDEERHSIESSLFADTFKGMVEEHGISGIFEKTKSIDRCRLEAKVEKLQMLGKELVNPDVALNLNEHIGIPKNILCHGDLWTANILWNSEGRVARLIDYQMIHFGNPAEDFVRLFTSTLSGEDRRKHWESLLETFYSYYLEKVRDHEGVGYTLEQLKESYRRYFVFGALTALPMFGPVVDLKLKEMPLEMQPEYQETVVRNLECLLEDIEEFYLYSKSKE